MIEVVVILLIVVGSIVGLAFWARRRRKRIDADPLSKKQLEKRNRAIDEGVRFTVFGIFALSGSWVVGKQCYTYLRYGVWESRSVIDLMRFFGSNWAASPDDWIGLYNVLEWMPMSIALVLAGFFLATAD